jgi:hypothetical protein
LKKRVECQGNWRNLLCKNPINLWSKTNCW